MQNIFIFNRRVDFGEISKAVAINCSSRQQHKPDRIHGKGITE